MNRKNRPNLTLAQFIAAGTTTPRGVELKAGQIVSLNDLAARSGR